jgi:hypothetical protein
MKKSDGRVRHPKTIKASSSTRSIRRVIKRKLNQDITLRRIKAGLYFAIPSIESSQVLFGLFLSDYLWAAELGEQLLAFVLFTAIEILIQIETSEQEGRMNEERGDLDRELSDPDLMNAYGAQMLRYLLEEIDEARDYLDGSLPSNITIIIVSFLMRAAYFGLLISKTDDQTLVFFKYFFAIGAAFVSIVSPLFNTHMLEKSKDQSDIRKKEMETIKKTMGKIHRRVKDVKPPSEVSGEGVMVASSSSDTRERVHTPRIFSLPKTPIDGKKKKRAKGKGKGRATTPPHYMLHTISSENKRRPSF